MQTAVEERIWAPFKRVVEADARSAYIRMRELWEYAVQARVMAKLCTSADCYSFRQKLAKPLCRRNLSQWNSVSAENPVTPTERMTSLPRLVICFAHLVKLCWFDSFSDIILYTEEAVLNIVSRPDGFSVPLCFSSSWQLPSQKGDLYR